MIWSRAFGAGGYEGIEPQRFCLYNQAYFQSKFIIIYYLLSYCGSKNIFGSENGCFKILTEKRRWKRKKPGQLNNRGKTKQFFKLFPQNAAKF